MNATVFSGKVVEWYREHCRRLPWREIKDPYKIWLSEIILQQTRVAQGLPYYRAFIRKYPNVYALAAAKEQDVLRIWQGLGYYARARNLLACAKTVVASYRGEFPDSFEELRKLKGIGEYTAAAIASFAFNQPVAPVDGNVHRVLARVFGITDDVASPNGKRKLSELANKLVPKDEPSVYNQAVMEFGALQCTPRKPGCEECPLRRSCIARRQGMELELPLKRKPARPVKRHFYYFVIRKGNEWLMRKRTQSDIWKGLWDFPLIETKTRTSAAELFRLAPIDVKERTISPLFRHVLSHQIIDARFVEVEWPSNKMLPPAPLFARARFLVPRRIAKVPKPVLISQFLGRRGIQ